MPHEMVPFMFRRIAPLAAATALAVALVACSAAFVRYGDDRYAHCMDLGELSLLSSSRDDAEQRMRGRVLELGGDTLLFGERGRSGRLSDAPEEIVQHRNTLVAAVAAVSGQQFAAEITAQPIEEPAVVAPAEAGRPRTPRITAEQIPNSPGQLWFYGAALRCNFPEQSQVPNRE